MQHYFDNLGFSLWSVMFWGVSPTYPQPQCSSQSGCCVIANDDIFDDSDIEYCILRSERVVEEEIVQGGK